MKKILNLITAWFLIILLSVSSLNVVQAETPENDQSEISAENTQIEAAGTDSAGEMIASAISENQEQVGSQQEEDAYITELTVEDFTAEVTYGTKKKAELVVAIYEEDKNLMLTSGKTTVDAGTGTASIKIDTWALPKNFVASAYLLDAQDHKPLCQQYTTDLYTKNIQDIRNSTPDDFPGREILTLDEKDDDDNFAVYNDSTIVREADGTNNIVWSWKDGTYTIFSSDDQVKGLKKGDTFAYKYKDDSVLLLKVASVSVSGSTVDVQPDTDIELTDFFDYMKIETDDSNAEYSVDNSQLEEGVTAFASVRTQSDTDAVGAVQGSGSLSHSVSYYIEKEFKTGSAEKVKLKGSVDYGFSFSVDFYLSLSYQYISVKTDYELGMSAQISSKLDVVKVPLGNISTYVLPCVQVGFKPSIVVSASASIKYSAKVKATIGFAYDSNSGMKSLCSWPSTDSKLEFAGTLFIGVEASPYIGIVNVEICAVDVEYSSGLEFTAKLPIAPAQNASSIHECSVCYDGTCNFKQEVTVNLKVLKGKIHKKETVYSKNAKLNDFYISVDYGEFAFTKCPHISYQVAVSLTDTAKNKVKDAVLSVTDSTTGKSVEIRTLQGKKDSVTTDSNGQANLYLPNGSYILKMQKDELSIEKKLSVQDRKTSLAVKDFPVKKTSGHSGKTGNITWNLDDDGTLSITGKGNMPNFTEDDDYNEVLPPWNQWDEGIYSVKIGDGITSVGDHSFDGCDNLSEVVLADTITVIGTSAFEDCWDLEEIRLPSSLKKLCSYAFMQCNLEVLEIPETVTDIEGNAFNSCGIRWIYFMGDRPSFTARAFCYTEVTAYYPAGNSTWSGIQRMKSTTDHYDVIWAPFNPDFNGTAPESMDGAEIDVAEADPSEDPAEISDEMEFGDGENSEESAEISPEPEEENAEEKQDEISGTEDNTVESQDGEDISDGIVTVSEKPVSYEIISIPTEGIACASLTTDMKPGTWCVLAVVKNKNAGDLLSSENLLYIGQKKVDSKGEAYYTYQLANTSQKTESCFFGEAADHVHSFTSWKTKRAATVFVEELKERTCTGCGKKEQKTGSKLKPVLQFNAGSVVLKLKQSTAGLKVKMAKGDSVVSWKSGNTKILKVKGKSNGTCKLAAQKKTGKATLTVRLKSGIQKKITVKVQKTPVKTSRITGLNKSLTLKKGRQVTLKPSKLPFTSLQKITYTSSNSKIVSVTSKGRLKARKPGKAKITVKSGSKKVTVTVIVKK